MWISQGEKFLANFWQVWRHLMIFGKTLVKSYSFLCVISQRKSWICSWSWYSRCEKNALMCELGFRWFAFICRTFSDDATTWWQSLFTVGSTLWRETLRCCQWMKSGESRMLIRGQFGPENVYWLDFCISAENWMILQKTLWGQRPWVSGHSASANGDAQPQEVCHCWVPTVPEASLW